MSNDVLIESYMLRICEKYRLKHIEEFTVDEITRELDPELTGQKYRYLLRRPRILNKLDEIN